MKEEKTITYAELLTQINILQAQGINNEQIVQQLITQCLIELDIVKIKEESKNANG